MIKNLLLASLILVAIIGLPLTVALFQQHQNLRSRASASTTLSFSPTSASSTPLVKNVGQTASFDVMVSPGNNAVSTIKLHIHYDSGKFQTISSSPFAVNATSFPTIVEGPINDTSGGNIYLTISVGSDPTKAIRTATRVGTLTLKTTNPTDTTSTIISFGSITQVFSVAATDQASENVLATATPAYVEIVAVPTATDTPAPTATPIPTDTPTPTPTPILQATRFSLHVFLHGIGDSGDNANPTGSTLSNHNPQRQTRTATISVYNATNQLVVTKQGPLDYNSDNGDFEGIVPMGFNITTGDYIVKVKSDSYLQRRIPAIVHIVTGSQVNLPSVSLIAGDSNGDNTLNILDYNMLIGCYSDLLPPTFCDNNKLLLTDLNDDGNVNQIDYNLFLREITVQNGD
jgi:hypothetical protein